MATLLPELEGIEAKVVVVDNNSADRFPDQIEGWLEKHDPNCLVRLIRSDSSADFSSGNNIGMASCMARNYLLLNSDTLVRPGAIRILRLCPAELE